MPLDTCTITGTVYKPQSAALADDVSIHVHRVSKPGANLAIVPFSVPVVSGAFSMVVPRGCTIYVSGRVDGLWKDSSGNHYTESAPKALAVPDAANANLEDLVAVAAVPSSGLTFKDEGVSLANLVGTVNVVGSGLSVSQTSPGVAQLSPAAMVNSLGALTDPNADRIAFWDDSANALAWLSLGTNLSITGTVLDAASGGVDGSGAAGRLAYWSDADTLTSSSNLTFNGSLLSLTGSLSIPVNADGSQNFGFDNTIVAPITESVIVATSAHTGFSGTQKTGLGYNIDLSGNRSTLVGAQGNISGDEGTGIGAQVQADRECFAGGFQAKALAIACISIGYQPRGTKFNEAWANGAKLCMGDNVWMGGQFSMGIGGGIDCDIGNVFILGTCSGDGQHNAPHPTGVVEGDCILGGDADTLNYTGYKRLILGRGPQHTSPFDVEFRPTDKVGTNGAGVNLTLRGGASTGSGAGGSVIITTTPAGGSGSSANSPVNRAIFPSTGGLVLPELSADAPQPSANNAVLYAKDNGSGASGLFFRRDDGSVVEIGAGGGGGANAALSNLASVAINTALLPNASSTIDFGSNSLRWNVGYFVEARANTVRATGGSGTNLTLQTNGTYLLLGDLSGNYAALSTATGNLSLGSGFQFGWSDTSNPAAAIDTGLKRVGAGIIGVTDGGATNYRDMRLRNLLDSNGAQLLTTRKTGWEAPTGTATRTAFDTATVTLEQLAQRVKALIDDAMGHGFIAA